MRSTNDIYRCESCSKEGLLRGFAKLSAEADRLQPEVDHEYRASFARDRDRIMYSEAFRRIVYKTQVFISGDPSKITTRLMHTVKVMQVAQTISRALKLNEDLTVAIALGHDIGHPPFGHPGEDALRENMMGVNGFEHNEESVWILMQFEGLNLTVETLEGILKHTAFDFTPYDRHSVERNDPFERFQIHGCARPFECKFNYFGQRKSDGKIQFKYPSSLEGQVVDIADEIVYLAHDLADFLRMGVILEGELPTWWLAEFGKEKQKERNPINRLVTGVIDKVDGQLQDIPDRRSLTISHPNDISEMVSKIKSWYTEIFKTKLRKQTKFAIESIGKIFSFYEKDPEGLKDYCPYYDRIFAYGYTGKNLVGHCVATMTDREISTVISDMKIGH